MSGVKVLDDTLDDTLDVKLVAVLEEFYRDVVVPGCAENGADPLKTFDSMLGHVKDAKLAEIVASIQSKT
ncbi:MULTISPECIES: hypothetical protein [unclassified Pseudomonas]|uniref:hypothetical protein n=1 Tax=unclassified Pseudomonas TaxID=196821 RepID=UPI0039B766FD